MYFTVTLEVKYHNAENLGWQVFDKCLRTPDPEKAEWMARHFAEKVIALDDERFEGPGTPISTIIRIDYEEN